MAAPADRNALSLLGTSHQSPGFGLVIVNNISVQELQQLQASTSITLIDVRTDAEVDRGVITGAHHIPLHLLPVRHGELDPAATLVVYCQSGARSAQACVWLSAQGFAEVSNLQGGIMAWMREGNALVHLS